MSVEQVRRGEAYEGPLPEGVIAAWWEWRGDSKGLRFVFAEEATPKQMVAAIRQLGGKAKEEPPAQDEAIAGRRSRGLRRPAQVDPSEMPEVVLLPQEVRCLEEHLSGCDGHGRAVFRTLIEGWHAAGHAVAPRAEAIDLRVRVGTRAHTLARLRPVEGERRQVIALGWKALRRQGTFPGEAMDRFQADVRQLGKGSLHVRDTTAHIWVHERFDLEKAGALVRALDALARSARPEPAETGEVAWNPQLPKLDIRAGRGTLAGIRDTLLGCEPRVREIFALLVQGWHDAGGQIACQRQGRIYLRLKARGHQFNLAVPAAPRGRRGPIIELSWGLSTYQFAGYLKHIPEDVARWEAAVSALPGFQAGDAIRWLVVGDEFGMDHARTLLDAMLQLKAASDRAG